MNKNYCRDLGLIRARSSPPYLNQGPSDLQSDALPNELSRQDDKGRNEGIVTHTGLKRKLSVPCVGKEETMYRNFSGYLPLGYF